ncbi:MAG TPA: hypothetical protein PLG97_07535 [Alcaligenes sp.]|nr:hypothetical protein [Alcaligenes sp.]HRL27356.1 hypothetical protein [Alcaligenes sp.]
MKPSTLFAAILGVAAGAGGAIYYYQNQAAVTPAPQAIANAKVTTLALDQQAAGELTSQSFLNLSDGVRSAVYEVQAQAGQIIKIAVSGPLRAQISVLRNGELLTRTARCEECPSSDDKNKVTTLGFKADFNDTYQVVVSGDNTSAYGPFKVVANTLKAYDGEPLTPGQNIADWALGGQKRYRLNIAADGLYRIDMKAEQDSLDAYLKLMDKRGMELVADDDGGENTDARIQAYLKAGEYIVQASSANGSPSFQGGFTLDIQAQEISAEPDLKDGDTLSLNQSARTGLFIGQPQAYTLQIAEPTLVTLQMNTQGFYAELQLGSLSGVQTGDDAGQQRIRTVLQPGEHPISVTGSVQAGVFSLEAAGEPVPANAGGGVLRVGETRDALMLEGVTRDVYTLTVRQAGRYSIAMNSPVFDTYLVLQQNGQTILEDDDSGGDMNSQMQVELQPGEYELQAVSLGDASSDMPYDILVQRQ